MYPLSARRRDASQVIPKSSKDCKVQLFPGQTESHCHHRLGLGLGADPSRTVETGWIKAVWVHQIRFHGDKDVLLLLGKPFLAWKAKAASIYACSHQQRAHPDTKAGVDWCTLQIITNFSKTSF